MAKVKIAQNPTFIAPVEIPRIGCAPVKVDFEFKYMDRETLADTFDKWNKARTALAESVSDGDRSLQHITAAEIALQVEQIKDLVVGWAFEDAFSEASITALVSTCVAAPQAVIDAYQAAYAPARLGN